MNSFVAFNKSIIGETLVVTPTTTPTTKDEALVAIIALTGYLKNNSVKLNVSDEYCDNLIELIK